MNQSDKMKEIPNEERPYEKCERYGAAVLSDTELLAAILRTGSQGESVLNLARRLLYHSGEDGILGLHHFSVEQLMNIKGIGKVKAMQIVCILELTRRLSKATASDSCSFTSADVVADYYMEDMRHENQEIVKLVMLNSKGKLIGDKDISKGTVNISVVTPREIFAEALSRHSVSIIVMHNHPSGDPNPSREDICLTKRIRQAGKVIGIELLDHIIIGDNCYVSLKNEGVL